VDKRDLTVIPFQTDSFAGTGSEEGTADWTDVTKPRGLGVCLQVEPHLIDEVNNVYAYTDDLAGIVGGVIALRDRGVLLSRGGNTISYSALVAAAITPADYATCDTLGLFRLAAPADGPLTVDFVGMRYGTDFLTNGSFDSGLTGWTTTGSTGEWTASAVTGNVRKTAGTAGTLLQTVSTTAGDWYVFGVACSTAAGAVSMRVDGVDVFQILGKAGTHPFQAASTAATIGVAVSTNFSGTFEGMTCFRFPARAGDMLDWVLTRPGGFTSAQIETADIAALNSIQGAALQYFTPAGDERKVADALTDIANSVGAWWSFDVETGKFRVQRFDTPGKTNIEPNTLGPSFSLTRTQTSSLTATALASNGSTWVEYAANTARFYGSDRVLRIEGERTNEAANPRALNAVVGTATLPTGWIIANGAGMSTSVASVGVEEGRSFVDLKISGTPTGLIWSMQPGGSLDAPANTGQTWTGSFFARLVGGSLTNISTIQCRIGERTGAGTVVITTAFPGTLSSTFTRYTGTRTISNTTVSAMSMQVGLALTASAVVTDLTLRLSWPQLEIGAFASSPILPASTISTGQSTRGADIVTAPLSKFGIGSTGVCTILGRSRIPQNAPSGTNQVIFQLDDGTENNRYRFQNSAGGANLAVSRTQAASTTTASATSTHTANSFFTWGVTIDGVGNIISYAEGGEVKSATGTAISGLQHLRVGHNATGGESIFGDMESFKVLPFAVTSTEIVSLVEKYPADAVVVARDIFSITARPADLRLNKQTVNWGKRWRPLGEDECSGSVTDVSKRSLTAPFFPVIYTYASTQTEARTWRDEVLESLFVYETPAVSEAERRGALFGPMRQSFDIELYGDNLDITPGCTVNITYPRFGLASGKNFRVLRVSREPISRAVTFTVWG
jgi:hypothetical protein